MPRAGAAGLGFNRQVAQAERSLRRVSGIIRDNKLPGSLAFIGEMLANYSKDHGPWKTQTGNLRRSITWQVLAPGESTRVRYETETEGIQTATAVNDTAGPMLVFMAGMKYAVYVEFKADYWVLRGSVEHFRPVIREMLGDKIKIRSASELLRKAA